MRLIYILFVGPFILVVWVFRVTKRLIMSIFLATHDEIYCPACGSVVSLVGRWECGACRYVFDGFAFSRCEVCGAKPPFLECQACGVGIKDPLRIP